MRDYMDRLHHLSNLPHLPSGPPPHVNRPSDWVKTKKKH